nr:MAG TPA: hypothetical protein [Caudoviricetes sp.]
MKFPLRGEISCDLLINRRSYLFSYKALYGMLRGTVYS